MGTACDFKNLLTCCSNEQYYWSNWDHLIHVNQDGKYESKWRIGKVKTARHCSGIQGMDDSDSMEISFLEEESDNDCLDMFFICLWGVNFWQRTDEFYGMFFISLWGHEFLTRNGWISTEIWMVHTVWYICSWVCPEYVLEILMNM